MQSLRGEREMSRGVFRGGEGRGSNEDPGRADSSDALRAQPPKLNEVTSDFAAAAPGKQEKSSKCLYKAPLGHFNLH